MGECVSSNSEHRLHQNTHKIPPPPTIRNNQKLTAGNLASIAKAETPLKVEIHKMNNLNPILRPMLPLNLVNPQSNSRLAGKITVIPQEFI